MFTNLIKYLKKIDKKLLKLKLLAVLILAVIVTSVHSKEIIENEVEDLNILVSSLFGGEPNILMIFGSSQSMGTSFGGDPAAISSIFGKSQFANWDQEDIITTCEKDRSGYLADPWAVAHCAGNASGHNICGITACSGTASGVCDSDRSFGRFISCIEDTYTSVIDIPTLYLNVLPGICLGAGLDPITECDTDEKRAHAAAALEIEALFREINTAGDPLAFGYRCGLGACQDATDPSCDNITELDAFKSCMQTAHIQPDVTTTPTTSTCSSSTPTGTAPSNSPCGQALYGTSKLDAVLNVFFDLLDVKEAGDPSLDKEVMPTLMCSDTNTLFDGTSNPIACEDYMTTPFRDVSDIVKGTGGGSTLPVTSGGPNKLLDLLDSADESAFPARIRPVGFGGTKSNPDIQGDRSCTGNDLIDGPQGGFAGGSQLSFDNIWKFFRGLEPGGRAILAGAIGHDDNPASSSTFGKDALRAFEIMLKTDKSTGRDCAGNFAIIITDGQDHCSGEVGGPLGGSYEQTGNFPPIRGFSNIRSSINATNALRVKFVNDPPNGNVSEVISFVICLGVPDEDLETVRMCNTMALTGGSHTGGIISHTDTDGNNFGTVDISFLTDPGLVAVGRNDSATTRLVGCSIGIEDELTGDCDFGTHTGLFNNAFFDPTATASTQLDLRAPFDSNDPAADPATTAFAFFVNSPEELADAINTILDLVSAFPTAGVAPTAPRSSTAVASRDRIFLAQLKPIEDQRLWQGRLGLYGFVQDPGNPGSRIIIRDPQPSAPGFTTITEDLTDELSDATIIDTLDIFSNNGLLNVNAKAPHWEAGKLLAERNLSTNPRRLFTIDNLDTTTIESATNGGIADFIRYEGDLIDFCYSGASGCSTGIDENNLGVSFADVSLLTEVPSFCQGTATTDCDATQSGSDVDCSTSFPLISGSACSTCLEQCFAFRVIDFLSGNTGIEPRGDPLGEPGVGESCPSDSTFIGCECLELDSVGNPIPGTSSDRCSVRLGDIFHSVTVLVGSPSALFFDTGFQAFAQGYRQRSAAAYVGANDVFIHAFHAGEFQDASLLSPIDNPFNNAPESLPFFDAGTGDEMFAFSSPTMQPDSISQNDPFTPSGIATPDFRFGDIKSFVHENNFQRSFFDGSSLIADVFIDGFTNGIADSAVCTSSEPVNTPNGLIDECGKEWHTVLLAGTRNGGGMYTALDITNADCTVSGAGDSCSTVDKHNTNSDAPEYPEHLWTLFDKDFGNTWSEPAIGRVRLQTESAGNVILTDRWVMFVGGGLHPTDVDPLDNASQADIDTHGNAFYAVDITTGQVVYKFHPQDPLPSGISDPDLSKMTCDMAAEVGVFDINADGFADIALAGDTCGRLWEFDISSPIIDTGNDVTSTGLRDNATIEAQNWTGHITFCSTDNAGQCDDPSTIVAEEREPIFFAPTVVLDDLGRRHVIVLTGNRRNPTDPVQSGKLYNFIDPFIPAFLAGGSATGQVFVTRGDFETDPGLIIDIVPIAGTDPQLFTVEGGSTVNNQGEFMVRFPNNIDTSGPSNVDDPNGEKGIGTPVVINRVLVFTSFAPAIGGDPNDPCQAGSGEGRVFALDYLTGEPALARIPGAQKFLDDQGNLPDVAGIKAAEGLPTPAQLTFGEKGSVLFSIAFSGSSEGGAAFLLWELPPFPTRTQTLFWEEII